MYVVRKFLCFLLERDVMGPAGLHFFSLCPFGVCGDSVLGNQTAG